MPPRADTNRPLPKRPQPPLETPTLLLSACPCFFNPRRACGTRVRTYTSASAASRGGELTLSLGRGRSLRPARVASSTGGPHNSTLERRKAGRPPGKSSWAGGPRSSARAAREKQASICFEFSPYQTFLLDLIKSTVAGECCQSQMVYWSVSCNAVHAYSGNLLVLWKFIVVIFLPF